MEAEGHEASRPCHGQSAARAGRKHTFQEQRFGSRSGSPPVSCLTFPSAILRSPGAAGIDSADIEAKASLSLQSP
eukprot:3554864-Lingulodinium_polyedra.AAC.1